MQLLHWEGEDKMNSDGEVLTIWPFSPSCMDTYIELEVFVFHINMNISVYNPKREHQMNF